MPKTSKSQTPGAVLLSFIEEYQTNAFALSKSLNVAYQSVTHIISGKSRISANMALRFAKYFGNSAEYWLDIQHTSEINKLSADKKFTSSLNKIQKAKKPSGKEEKKKKTTAYSKPNKKAAKAKSRKRIFKFKTGKKSKR